MKKIKGLLYCCKVKPYLTRNDLVNEKGEFYKHWQLGGELDRKHLYGDTPILNGKIVAECDFEVEYFDYMKAECLTHTYLDLLKKSCLTDKQMYDYLKGKNGYVIHIKNLRIFDEPKELDDFTTRTPVYYDSIICDSCTNFGFDCKKCRYSYDYQQVIKAPKNMMKVCEWDIEDKVLISIKPERLCKILNGEKTIVVRRKVLKEMLNNASK